MGKTCTDFLSFGFLPPISGFIRPGKFIGDLANVLHSLNIRTSGFYLLI